MSSTIVNSVLKRVKQPDLIKILSEELSGTELNSLLLEVFNQRVAGHTPPQLLNLYQLNRFVKPADLPVIPLKKTELDILELFQKFSFQPIELSPVSILGSCSVVATADQKKILSALRGTEVLADATNAIALHIADLKETKKNKFNHDEKYRFGTIQRHLRTVTIKEKGHTPHFKIGCLVTAGYDSGNYAFEKTSLNEHIGVMIDLFRNYFKADAIKFRLICRSGYEKPLDLATHVREFVKKHHEVIVDIVEKPDKEINYYKGIQYKVDITVKGKHYEIGDGGFADWTQQLLQNKKERMLSTGFGFELMYRILQGDI